MKEVAQKYLGNIQEDSELEQQAKIAHDNNNYLEVLLKKIDLAKGRILTKSTSDVEIGIIKSRDLVLRDGDILETSTGKLVLIKLESEKFMIISFEQAFTDNQTMNLVSLGHLLGNHHYPIKIESNQIYVRLITEAKVLVKMIEELAIPGLKIAFEVNNDRDIPNTTHRH